MAETKRINFNVGEEERIRVASLMEASGIASQRELFMAALDLFEKVHREVVEQRHTVLGVPASLASFVLREVGRRAGGARILAEPTGDRYRWLVNRPGWRSTPWVKGRRLHVSDVGRLVTWADGDTSEVAESLQLPEEAISECLAYCEENRNLVEAEAREAARRTNEAVVEVRTRFGLVP